MNFRQGEFVTVNSRKYDGTVRRSWKCEFVAESQATIDLVGVFEQTVEHPDLGRVEKETISYERFYLNRWYNHFRFEQPAGTLRNYYINICLPPKLSLDVIDYVDLDIDLILWPDGRLITLDLDEFEANADAFSYPIDVRERALRTLDEVHTLISNYSDVRQAMAQL